MPGELVAWFSKDASNFGFFFIPASICSINHF